MLGVAFERQIDGPGFTACHWPTIPSRLVISASVSSGDPKSHAAIIIAMTAMAAMAAVTAMPAVTASGRYDR